jgi:alanyl-tRNA synthetase
VTADELRRAWAEFFTARGHTGVPSAGLVPHHPSAPMFTNSGMMQFVPYFLGEEDVPFDPPRAWSIQKCVRAGGKHNDLDAIGRSLRHLSFFEMLGNFSFGDYFKAEAIPWAWEFLTEVLGLDPDRMWVTVHVSDDEAEEIWAGGVGLPRERIQRLDKDNFWEMGDVGPCGPSSEVFWDFGPDLGPEGGPANPAAEERYVEIWNLVFTQYFRGPDGELSDLPSKNVDTGAGLERILGVLAASPSLYAADTLSVLTDRAQEVTGRRFGVDRLGDIALRLLADHTRTVAFLVSDGVMPSNEERGYVLRRVLRRAVYFSYLLGVDAPVLPPMIRTCIDLMGRAYPDLAANADSVLTIVTREEERFRQTLRTGSAMLDAELDRLGPSRAGAPPVLDGSVAFQLHDTYGFPLEVTQEILAERGVELDVDGFDAAMADQRARAKAAAKGGSIAVGDEIEAFRAVMTEHGPTEFVGRELDSTSTTVIGVVPGSASEGGDEGTVSVFLRRSPFYAESGGQVGDTGEIRTDRGRAEVLDTVYALPGLHRHVARIVEGSLVAGDEAVVSIDRDRRNAIRRHHTGTHIVHWALREVLGDHVKQQGSLVGPDRLRFDFSHFESLTEDEIAAIEDLANQEILADHEARHYETTMDDARKKGAIAFFGDKYGDIVRVLEAGPHSIELCGGTHVGRLGEIGPVKIVGEESIGSNLRRITAVAGTGPVQRLREREQQIAQVAQVAGVPASDLVNGVNRLRDQLRSSQDEVRALRLQVTAGRAAELAAEADDGVVVARIDGTDRGELRDMAASLRDRPGMRAVVLGGAPEGGGAALVIATTEDSGLHAGELLADVKKLIQGGGSNDPRLVVAGGKNADGVEPALEAVRTAIGA